MDRLAGSIASGRALQQVDLARFEMLDMGASPLYDRCHELPTTGSHIHTDIRG